MHLPRLAPLLTLALGTLLCSAPGCGSKPHRNFDVAAPNEPESPAAVPELRINEVMSANSTSIEDENGDSSDWIELFNGGDAPVELSGYALSDDPENLRKWTFGEQTIGAGEYLLVFASGKDIRFIEQQPPEPWQGLTEYVWYWSDIDYETPGRSRVDFDLFPDSVTGLSDGRRVISAELFLADNEPTLNWAVAMINMGFAGWDAADTYDFSGYNDACIQMTLAEGAQLEVRLCQANVDCGAGYSVTLTGNGVEDYCYEIPIRGNPRILDLSVLTSLQLHAVEPEQPTNVLVTDLVFSHGGYFLHTNFRVSAGGERVILSDPQAQIVDSAEATALVADVSLGRDPDRPERWVVFDQATPGAVNSSSSYAGLSPPPSAYPPPGFYSEPVAVTLSVAPNSTVYYTTDGSVPTRDSHTYSEPIVLDQSTVLRSVTATENMLSSVPLTVTYFVGEQHSLPVLSIATEPALLFDPETGIYELGPDASDEFPYHGANFWKKIEIPATVQFFEPDGSLGFETGVGLRIFGNYSRGYDMKSLSLHFRGEYGMTLLDYPLFPDHPELAQFDSFVLRNSGNDFADTMFRDALGSLLTEGMGISYQQYRPSIVYINGEYWGIHNVREKLAEAYFFTNFGLSQRDFDLLGPWGRVQAGTSRDYDALLEYMELNGAAAAEHYAHIGAELDLDNFIDYTCAQFYLANQDWPGNNIKWWRTHEPGARWRWVLYDLDATFGSPEQDMISFATELNDSWPNPEWSTFLLRTLLQNQQFAARLANRCAVWLSTHFEPARVLARIDQLAQAIESEIPRFFARWDHDPADWPREVAELRQFAPSRPDHMRQNFVTYFGFGGTYALTITADGGRVELEGIVTAPGGYSVQLFLGNPVTLTAVPSAGRHFAGWSDGEARAERVIDPDGDLELVAQFE